MSIVKCLMCGVMLLLMTSNAVFGSDSTPAMKQFLVHFSLGPAWLPSKAPNEQTAFAEHGRNLKRLRDEGRITVGARYADKGMIVLLADNEAAARKEMDADPGVLSGIFLYELHELKVFYEGELKKR